MTRTTPASLACRVDGARHTQRLAVARAEPQWRRFSRLGATTSMGEWRRIIRERVAAHRGPADRIGPDAILHWVLLEYDPFATLAHTRAHTDTTVTAYVDRPDPLTAPQLDALTELFREYLAWPPALGPKADNLMRVARRLGVGRPAFPGSETIRLPQRVTARQSSHRRSTSNARTGDLSRLLCAAQAVV